jgi:hypothetical protein
MEFQNKSGSDIKFQYLHKDYDHWSAELSYRRGGESLLEREHYFRDLRGIRVRDGNRFYQVSSAALANFHRVCDSSPNCTIAYLDNGRMAVARK